MRAAQLAALALSLTVTGTLAAPRPALKRDGPSTDVTDAPPSTEDGPSGPSGNSTQGAEYQSGNTNNTSPAITDTTEVTGSKSGAGPDNSGGGDSTQVPDIATGSGDGTSSTNSTTQVGSGGPDEDVSDGPSGGNSTQSTDGPDTTTGPDDETSSSNSTTSDVGSDSGSGGGNSSMTGSNDSDVTGDGMSSITVPLPKGGECAKVPDIKTSWKKPAQKAKRFVGYMSAFHGALTQSLTPVLPNKEQLDLLTHVVLSFVQLGQQPGGGTLFGGFVESLSHDWNNGTDIAKRIRKQNPKLKVIAALGGWNLDQGFREFAKTDASRKSFAEGLATFVNKYDVYPVWFSQNWKTTHPIDWCDRVNVVLFLSAIRDALTKLEGETKKKYEISVALPAKVSNMLSYDKETIPQIEKVIDAWGLMTYDYINRRDFVMGHHSGVAVVKKTVEEYKKRGMTLSMMEVGVAMYAKWFDVSSVQTDATASKHIGSSMGQWTFENKADGSDLENSGTWLFNETIMGPMANTYLDKNFYAKYGTKLTASWKEALAKPMNDKEAGASSYFDEKNKIFWTWVGHEDITAMCEDWIGEVGGVLTWAVNQDADGSPHFKAISKCIQGGGGSSAKGDGDKGDELEDGGKVDAGSSGDKGDARDEPDTTSGPSEGGGGDKGDTGGGPDETAKQDDSGTPDQSGKPEGTGGAPDTGKPDEGGIPDETGQPSDTGSSDQGTSDEAVTPDGTGDANKGTTGDKTDGGDAGGEPDKEDKSEEGEELRESGGSGAGDKGDEPST